MNTTTAGWYPDPTLRFELRYHNGEQWTADVSTDGARYVDPLGTRPTTSPSPTARNAPATAAMVLGIVAIAIGWIPIIVVLGIVATILALVLGTIGRRRAKRTGAGGAFALTGLITGTCAVFVCIGGVLFTVSMLRAFDRFENPPASETRITSCTRDGDDVTAVGELRNVHDEPAEFSVRVHFVRTGTDNPRRQALVELGLIGPDQTATFEVTRSLSLEDIDCIVGAVRGPLPYGIDPGL